MLGKRNGLLNRTGSPRGLFSKELNDIHEYLNNIWGVTQDLIGLGPRKKPLGLDFLIMDIVNLLEVI